MKANETTATLVVCSLFIILSIVYLAHVSRESSRHMYSDVTQDVRTLRSHVDEIASIVTERLENLESGLPDADKEELATATRDELVREIVRLRTELRDKETVLRKVANATQYYLEYGDNGIPPP